jgi:hypothetical protein
MTTFPLAARTAAAPRAKTVYYLRALVALAMIGTWIFAATSGAVLWLSPRGQSAQAAPLLLALARSAWIDVHVVSSFLAVALTVTHVAVMRRGALAYLRLVLTGRRRLSGATRRPKRIVIVRAVLVVVLLVTVPIAIASGIIPWLAADGRRSGQQLLLFAVTKRGWSDIHTYTALGALVVAALHVTVVRMGLVTDLRLLATGQRSAPRRVPPSESQAA